MSNITTIGDHTFKIPVSREKADILFINDRDPVWNREKALNDYRDIWYDFLPGKDGTKLWQDTTLYNQDGELISLNSEDSKWITWAYEREWYRRASGVHVKIGDKIEWFTGDAWFQLAWCKTRRPDKKGDYFDFRQFQLWYYQLLWYIEKEEHIAGGAFSKAKKTGITNLTWLLYLNRATMIKNLNLGAMNVDQDKASKTFREHFMYAFNNLPLPLRPQIKSKSETDGLITFGYRFGNSKKNAKRRDAHDGELGTTVMCVPCVLHAFDIDVFFMQWYDEFPKYKQDFGEIYRSNAEGTAIQDINIGKKILTSYTPEGETPSFNSARDIYFNSELRTIEPKSDGRTKSGLIEWHIPAYQSWTSEFDKYGKCREQEAMKKIIARRELKKGSARELLAETRMYANSKREAWMAGGVGSVLDNARISELLADVEEEERVSPEPPYREGRLLWENELWNINPNLRRKGEIGPVRFVPLTEEELYRGDTGRLREYNEIPNAQKNFALKHGRDEWRNLVAPMEFLSTLGADPTSHAAGSEVVQKSKNAFYVRSRVNEAVDSRFGEISSGLLMYEYFDRPETPDEAYDDLLKLIIYTGALSAVEANAPYMATRLMEEGLGNYMLVKDDNGILTVWKRHMGLAHEEDKSYHLLRTTATAHSKDILEAFVRLMKSQIMKPPPGNKSYGETIKSARLLSQLMDIDINNTKVFDLFMAYGWCLLADEVYTGMLIHMDTGNADDEIAAAFRVLGAVRQAG
jgi:hypothetical protein